MYPDIPYQPFYLYYYDYRQGLFQKILACYQQKRWVRLSFRDGTTAEGFIRTYDLSRGVLIYIPMQRYMISFEGVRVDSLQKAQNCIGKRSTLKLPNNISLTFTIEGVDQSQNISGWVNINELMSVAGQVVDANCI
ncbi:hypothetical protein M3226_22680 [Neobacillus cucumis]|uniref:hypothetical protein n=1 Tax=Neobacillus cucumis TaxID=1740721 RepID=UPI00204244CE|nr:hypothetical protein [Neobacillus cucumis]MCM3728458.1 hypothetical protein [Neobacillus cucumis]